MLLFEGDEVSRAAQHGVLAGDAEFLSERDGKRSRFMPADTTRRACQIQQIEVVVRGAISAAMEH